MTKQEFKQAFKIAQSDDDLSNVDNSNLYGCGLRGFEPVHTTLKAVARHIRWQAHLLNGNWDMEEVDQIAWIAKKKFIIIG